MATPFFGIERLHTVVQSNDSSIQKHRRIRSQCVPKKIAGPGRGLKILQFTRKRRIVVVVLPSIGHQVGRWIAQPGSTTIAVDKTCVAEQEPCDGNRARYWSSLNSSSRRGAPTFVPHRNRPESGDGVVSFVAPLPSLCCAAVKTWVNKAIAVDAAVPSLQFPPFHPPNDRAAADSATQSERMRTLVACDP